MGTWSDMKKLATDLLSGDERAIQEIHRRVNALQELILSVGENLPSFSSERTLTYEAAIRYFVQARPHDERIVKGALLRAPHREQDTITVIQVFLDKQSNLLYTSRGRPYGRQML